MLGIKSGVGKRLKEKFPSLLLWRCLNHRLELAVADAISSTGGFFSIQSVIEKIHNIYSSKLQRQSKDIASDLELQIQKIGKIFTITWVASPTEQ